MTTYKGIKGLGIQNITSDAASSQVGGGTWTSGTAMNTARLSGVGAGVSQTSAIMASGYTGTGPGATANTETYNGSAWTETGDLAREFFYSNGFGTTTAMIVAGKDGPPGPGNDKPAATESFDGTSWSSPGANINNNRFFGGCCGISTAGIVFGGQAPGATNYVETWDGSSWTETTELNTAKQRINSGTGTQTAALSAGGSPSTTEEWNGSAWTEIVDPNTGRDYAAKSGIVTAALMFGGNPPTAATEYWDGSSWTEVGDLGTARAYLGPAGSGQPGANANSLAFGGQSTTIIGNTEEWNAPATFRQLNIGDIYYNADPSSGVLKYVGYGTGAWASGGNLNQARDQMGGAGTNTAAIAAGGDDPSPAHTAKSEEYNGSAWAEGDDMNQARVQIGGLGTQTAALFVSGATTAVQDTVESYNGSAWTETTELNTGRRSLGSGGTTTAAIVFAGDNTSDPGGEEIKTETYNGSAWTEQPDMNTARRLVAGSGTTTSAIVFGGIPNPARALTEVYDGSSWSETGDLNTVREDPGGAAGGNTAALCFGGNPQVANAELFNGSSWTEVADLSTGRSGIAHNGIGDSIKTLAVGGTPDTAATEEWTTPEALKTLASTNA
jgi:hypothetical protein